MSTHSENYWRRILPPNSARKAAGRWVIGDAIGSCEVIQILGGPGKSGMGIVYVCHDYFNDETVAIKTFQNRFLEDPAIIERFKWEAETWVRIGKHTNIVEAKRVENHAGKPHIYLEYVVGDERYGVSLSGWIYHGGLFRHGKPDVPLIFDFAIQFCHGMVHAEKRFHEMGKGFVHRDVKPANILVTRDKIVKVTDFGLVKAFADLDRNIPMITVEDGVSRRLSMSKSGAICGTPPYMSPEQCLGSKDIDIRSDIYAFGCVLYEMLTGRLVFNGRTMGEFVRYHLKTKPHSPNVQRDLDMVVLKCLEKRPANRYENFKELEGILSSLYRKLTGKEVKKPDTEPLRWRELNDKGLSLLNLGYKEEAISCFIEALRTNPDEDEIHINLGDAYKAQGRLDDALTEYKEALRIDPNDVVAHSNLANIYQSQGKLDEVITEYKKILQTHLGDSSAHCEMGDVYKSQGKLDEAIKEYFEALRIDPRYKIAHSSLADVFKTQGRLDEAVKEYREVLRLDPNSVFTHYLLGNIYKSQMRLGEAAAEYRQELRVNPTYSYLHSDLGEVYQTQGKLDEAVKEYQEELRLNPNHASVRITLGSAYQAQGKLREAISEYKQALKIASDHGEDYAEAHKCLGGAYEAQGRLDDAKREYRQALEQWKRRLAVAQVSDEKSAILQAQNYIKELENKLR